jgi:RHS repeat-associated protein
MKAAGRLLLGVAAALAPAALEAQGIPLGPEFQANTYTTGRQGHPVVASAGDGSFVVVWARGPGNPGIFGRMYDDQGSPKGSEFQVNSGTAVPGQYPSVAADASGGFVVVWGDGADQTSHGQRFDSTGAKIGSELFLPRIEPQVASDAAGKFVVVSTHWIPTLFGPQVVGDLVAQQFDASGAPAGSEFVVSEYTVTYNEAIVGYTTDFPADRAIAMQRGGDFVVVWNVGEESYPKGARPANASYRGVFGQRFDKTGARRGPVFPVTTSGTTSTREPAVALDPVGNFVVVWSNDAQDGGGRGIRGQRFDGSGEKVGSEFQVNTYTTGDQTTPSVAIDATGDFVVVWNSAGQDGSSSGVFGARFDRHGTPLGAEFPVNVFTAGAQQAPQIAADGRGVVAAWESADQDGDGFGVFGRRQNLHAEGLAVDETAATGTTSDHNGVLEPGETVFVSPEWRNVGAVSLPLTGSATSPACAPAAACVAVEDGSADYGTVAASALGICNDGSPDACYRVAASGPRPGTHWDSDISETLSGGGVHPWRIHVGDSFSDVPRSQPFYKKIETLLHTGITTGCTATQYCPGATVSRDQMSIFIAKGIAGLGELVPVTGQVGASVYNCSSGGASLFTDVAPTDAFCKHVHYLAAQNVTLGCTGTTYCPEQSVTRDAMASFIAKAVVAPGGGPAVPITYSDAVTGLSYSCAAASPSIHFTDVPVSNPFCNHIHYLWSRGMVSGCTATTYCPSQSVTRDAMAKFLANGFGLQLYAPSVKPGVTSSNTAPTVSAGSDKAVTQTGASTAVPLSGTASDDGLPNPPGSLSHHWSQLSGPGTVTFDNASSLATTAHFPQAALYILRLTASDGLLSSTSDVTINVNPTGGVPADPGSLAPPLDPGVATDVATSTQFLYTGPDAVQTGVADGTIDPRRSAVVRGRVLTRDGTPLSGVKVAILQHTELGQTLSRADGMFDMAVNGGGILTFRYEKPGVLPAQRQVAVPWGDFAFVPDVTLVPADSAVTLIDLTSPAPFQVARGNPVTDADGTRQATVLFPAGTTAGLVQPNGSTVPTTQLHVRLTEYTVGPSGPSAMPGELPPTSSYTYATELGADEAVAKVNGRDVVFNHPVLLYLENLTHVPVGQSVPVGYYDPARSAWVGAPNGRVIKVIGKTSGKADLDVNGDGAADTGAALTALGITDAERQQLATLYAAGTSLWRTPIDHFSTIDTNFPAICEGACAPPNEPPPPPPSCQNNTGGSIIGCERQTLGEDVPIAGTPFSLHYQSDRVPGRTAERSLLLGLTTKGVPSGVQGTQLEVLVAGQKLAQDFPTNTASASVSWDGNDAYGRQVVGSTRVTVRIGYTYKLVPAAPAVAVISWARFSGIPMSGGFARGSVTLWQEYTSTITRWDSRGIGLGGWTLSALHAYDPLGRVIHFGDGTRRDASTLSAGPIPAATINTIAGKTPGGFGGDGGPATDARFRYPYGLAVGPDGSLYIADSQNHRVRRVGTDGIITTVAGNGTAAFAGDNGPATAAELNNPVGVAVGPDGSLFIVDQNNNRIRQVRPDGKIVTVAGNGSSTFGGDGGPATSAGLLPWGVAVGPDGAVYIADRSNSRIRMVDQNGIITSIAGNGLAGPNGDGVPATTVNLGVPSDVAVGPDGSLYIIVGGPGRVRKVTPQGILSTVAGTTAGFSGDGGPAKTAQIDSPVRLAVGPDGSIYIPDTGNQRLRWIGSEGIIATIAGNGLAGFSGDGGLAPRAQFNDPYAVAVGPDGSVYVADSFNQRIRKVAYALPGISPSDILIPSIDGAEVYVFSGAGRHKKTLEALTGAVRGQFTYDSENRLASVDDGDGNVTTIQRDGGGNPTGILAPFGQHTTLTLGANGFLTSIKDPVNNQVSLTSTAGGLLTQLTDPRGGVHKFTYDATGRLTKDEDPAGGFKTLARTETTTGATVSVTTKLGRATTYLSERLPSGALHRVLTEPGAVVTDMLINIDGSQTTTSPDGSVEVVVLGADPRWGLLAPTIASYTRTTPSSLSRTVTETRTATLSSPTDPLSLLTLTDKTIENGRTWTTTYQSATSTLTRTSPVGRSVSSTLNARGRVVTRQVGGLSAETFSYDAKGRLVTAAQGTGGATRTATLVYNPQGFLDHITDSLGRTGSFVYDAAGRITSQTLPGSLTVGLGYDASGNPTALTMPLGAGHAFAYTPVDLISTYTPPALPIGPTPTGYTFDADRNLTRVTRPDAILVDLGYDTAGRLGSIALPAGSLGISYDAASRPTSLTSPSGPTLASSYDADLITGGALSGSVTGSVGLTYDTTFRLASVSVNGANSIAMGYDNDDLPTSAGAMTLTWSAQGLLTGSALGVVTDAWTYSGFGEPTAYTASVSATPQFSQSYTRDKIGRLTALSETIVGVTNTYAYTYDSAGRLIEVDKNGAAVETYTYDANGNRLSFTGSGGPQLATYDVQDRLTAYKGNTYTYTKAGELQQRGAGAVVTTFGYDPLGNLLNLTLTDGTAIAYLVDGRKRRVGKKVNGTLVQGFLYQTDLRPVAELNGAGTVVSRFVYDTTRENVPAYMTKGGQTYRVVTDAIGSVRLVINTATGSIAQRMDYDGFGQVVNDTSPGFQPFGFAGGLYDKDTKLVRFGARDYNPETGRWTVKDPIGFAGGNANLYAYVANDPVNSSDPTGLAAPLLVFDEKKFAEKSGEKIVQKVVCKQLNVPGLNNPKANKERENLDKISKEGEKGTWDLWESIKSIFSGFGK